MIWFLLYCLLFRSLSSKFFNQHGLLYNPWCTFHIQEFQSKWVIVDGFIWVGNSSSMILIAEVFWWTFKSEISYTLWQGVKVLYQGQPLSCDFLQAEHLYRTSTVHFLFPLFIQSIIIIIYVLCIINTPSVLWPYYRAESDRIPRNTWPLYVCGVWGP